MEQLLQLYSVSDILTFLVFFSLAAKGVITFFDWAVKGLREFFGKEFNEEQEQNEICQRITDAEATIQQLAKNDDDLAKALIDLTKKVDTLIVSDRDDIKSFLTKEHHHYCYDKKWIDDYSLECCERRFGHYRDEGGNSFIEGFMDELRSLPKQPPKE